MSVADPFPWITTLGLDVMPPSHIPGRGGSSVSSFRRHGPRADVAVATPIRLPFHASSYCVRLSKGTGGRGGSNAYVVPM
jgi:hypothetical protein